MQQSGSLVVASVVERCSTLLPEGFDAQVESCRRVGASSVLRTTTSSLDRAGSCMEASRCVDYPRRFPESGWKCGRVPTLTLPFPTPRLAPAHSATRSFEWSGAADRPTSAWNLVPRPVISPAHVQLALLHDHQLSLAGHDEGWNAGLWELGTSPSLPMMAPIPNWASSSSFLFASG